MLLDTSIRNCLAENEHPRFAGDSPEQFKTSQTTFETEMSVKDYSRTRRCNQKWPSIADLRVQKP